MLGDMGDRLDRLDTEIAKFHRKQPVEVPNVRRQDRREPRMENCDAYEYGSDIEEDAFIEVEVRRVRYR